MKAFHSGREAKEFVISGDLLYIITPLRNILNIDGEND